MICFRLALTSRATAGPEGKSYAVELPFFKEVDPEVCDSAGWMRGLD
jgi:hypothetical protein